MEISHPCPVPTGFVDIPPLHTTSSSSSGLLDPYSASGSGSCGDPGRVEFPYEMLVARDADSPTRSLRSRQDELDAAARASAILRLPTKRLNGKVYYGWLWKKGASFRTWKKRFFLLHGCTLTYYKKACVIETEQMGPRCLDMPPTGGLRVAGAELTEETSFGIRITSSSGRVMYIQAGNRQTRLQWLGVLQLAPYNRYSEVTERATAMSSDVIYHQSSMESNSLQSSVSSDEVDVADAEIQGWLHVRGRLGYRRRYVSLLNGHLSISGFSLLRGKKKVQREVISVSLWRGHEFGLHVQLDRHREFYAHAASKEERQRWLNALQLTL